ncbi:hypothetical protein EUGRSUZ_E03888 [Eucalyptus grandis]|uniref:Uncharacterized protein n=2 Tax=Eucalyptus grandis TaxID=71139 RepID=A0ACC3L1N0_EUCGR|nr:hypothetical protein EUGRSUZ_E03888 [Eucalyptus grandis]
MWKSRSWPPNFLESLQNHTPTQTRSSVYEADLLVRNRNRRRNCSNRTRGFHRRRCSRIRWTFLNLSVSRNMTLELDHCVNPVALDHRVGAHVWRDDPSIVDEEAQSPMVVDPDQPVPILRRDERSGRKMRELAEGQRHSDGMPENKLFETVD